MSEKPVFYRSVYYAGNQTFKTAQHIAAVIRAAAEAKATDLTIHVTSLDIERLKIVARKACNDEDLLYNDNHGVLVELEDALDALITEPGTQK